MSHQVLSIFVAISLATGARAQSNIDANADPKPVLELVNRLYNLSEQDKLGTPEGQTLRSGEMANAKMSSFGAVPKPDKILMLADGKAVARIPAADKRPDLYLFLERAPAGLWKWTSYRALALTGMLEYLRKELRKKSPLTTAETTTLRNLELTLSSDRDLVAWFEAHRTELDAIRLKTRANKPIVSRATNSVAKRLARLGLSLSTMADGIVSITIGGMVDNEVGYMFAPGTKVPAIAPERYIWIEPLGGDWYLYKTT